MRTFGPCGSTGGPRYLRGAGRDRDAGDARARADARCERESAVEGQGTETWTRIWRTCRLELLAEDRVVDMQQAIAQFQRSVALDPQFAAAYIGLAEAGLFLAEYDVTDDRDARFDPALEQASIWSTCIGSRSGQRRGLSRARGDEDWTDLTVAEVDTARSGAEPELGPGLSRFGRGAVRMPERRDEALDSLIGRASSTPCSRPTTSSRPPSFCMSAATCRRRGPAVGGPAPGAGRSSRTGTAERITGPRAGTVDGGHRVSRARAGLDPLSEASRRGLVRAYLDLGDEHAAEPMVDDDPAGKGRVARVGMLLAYPQGLAAGRRTRLPGGSKAWYPFEPEHRGGAIVYDAIRMHARVTGDFERARVAIAELDRARVLERRRRGTGPRGSSRHTAMRKSRSPTWGLLNGGEPERGSGSCSSTRSLPA